MNQYLQRESLRALVLVGKKISYVEAHIVYDTANRIFGFNNWGTSVSDITIDHKVKDKDGIWQIAVSVKAKAWVRGAESMGHEDIGNHCTKGKDYGDTLHRAQKAAITDAKKRALRTFGNALGNCCYDKNLMKRNLSTMRGVNSLPPQAQPPKPPAPPTITAPPVAQQSKTTTTISRPPQQQQLPLQPIVPQQQPPPLPPQPQSLPLQQQKQQAQQQQLDESTIDYMAGVDINEFNADEISNQNFDPEQKRQKTIHSLPSVALEQAISHTNGPQPCLLPIQPINASHPPHPMRLPQPPQLNNKQPRPPPTSFF